MQIGIGLGITNLRGRRLGFSVAASIATWDSDTDTYTQDLFVVDASFATWDSDTDTYTQDLFVVDASFATWDSDTDTYTRTTYGA